MEPVLKRRLLVAIIIIALIIIFLPIPFGHFKLKKKENNIQNIPPAPSQASVQSIPSSVDTTTATITPANNTSGFTPNQTQQTGDPMTQAGNNASPGSTTTVLNSNNTNTEAASNTVTMPAAQMNNANLNVPASSVTSNAAMPTVTANATPATSTTTAIMPAATPNIAPAQSVTMTAPVASNNPVNTATTTMSGPQLAAKTVSITNTNTSAPISTPAVNDAAGNGKLSSMQPQSSLPDTDGSNTAPLAGDDVNLPSTPQIIDESQDASSNPTDVDTNNMDLPIKQKHKSTITTHAKKPYHVRSDDVTSANVVSSSHHEKTTIAAKKEKEKIAAQHHQVKLTRPVEKVSHEKLTSHASKIATHGNWVVQAASFPEKSTTQQVVNKLKAEGFHAFIEEAKVNGKTVYRAYVGTFTNKEQAESKIETINKKLHTKAYVHELSK